MTTSRLQRTVGQPTTVQPRSRFRRGGDARTAQHFPIGTRGLTAHQVVQVVGGRYANRAYPPESDWGDLQVGVRDTVKESAIWGGTRWVLREIAIPAGALHATPWHGALLFVQPLHSGIVTPDAETLTLDHEQLVFAAHGPWAHPLGNIEVTNDGISARRWDPARGQYERVHTTLVAADDTTPMGDPRHDQLVVETAARVVEVFRRGFHLTVAAAYTHQPYWTIFDEVREAEAQVWTEILDPAAAAVAAVSPPLLSPPWDRLHQQLVARSRRERQFAPTAQRDRLALHTQIQHSVDAARRAAQLPDELTFYRSLITFDDPVARAAAYRDGNQRMGAILDHSWLPHVGRFNAIARAAGFADYSECMIKRQLGRSSDEVWQTLHEVCTETAAPYAEMLADLQGRQGERPLTIADVHACLNGGRTVGGTPPTLTIDAALEIAHAFFRDMGFDLDQAPWDQLVLDVRNRAQRMPGHMATALTSEGQGRGFAFVTLPEALTLEELTILLYEISQAIQHQAAGASAGGWMTLMARDGESQQVGKAVHDIVQQLLTDPTVLQHYLAAHPQFTPAYLAGYARQAGYTELWRSRRFLMLALFEALLYRRRDWEQPSRVLNRDEILATWHAWVRRFLRVDPLTETGFGEWGWKWHMTSADFAFYIGNYYLNALLTGRAGQALRRHGHGPAMLARFGAAVRPLYAAGSSATRADFAAAIAAMEQGTAGE